MRSQSAGLQFDSRMMKCSLRTACHSTAFRPRSGWSCGSTTNRPLAPKRRGVAIGRLACIRHKCHIKAALPNQRNVPIEAPALFVGFAATMAECDFSRSCIIGYGSARARQAAGAEFAEPHLAHHHMARRLIRSATLALCPRAGAHCADQGRRRTQETLLIEWQHSRDSRSNRVSLGRPRNLGPISVKLRHPGHVPARSTAVHIAKETPGHSFGHSFRRTEREQTQTNLTKKC